jgi:predicted DNA-binding transcriptional regulator YafY
VRPVVRRLRRALFLMPYVARHPKGVSLGDLAALMKIPPHQMEQEVRDLIQVGIPNGTPGDFFDIEIEGRGATARVRAHPSRLLRRPPGLTRQEATALLLGANTLRGTGLPVFEEALSRATTKIRRALTTSASSLPGAVSMETSNPVEPDVVATLMRATRDRRVVELDYASLSGKPRRKIVVEPYGLMNHSGGWYVLGRSLTHGEDRVFVFKVERIAAVAVRDERFEAPADFDVRKYRGDRMFIAGLARVEVKLRLRGAAARALGGLFKHARLERGGTIVVKFRDCLTGWLATWVLRQGPDVEVLAPPRLAEWVAELARRVGHAHETATTAAPDLAAMSK